MPRPHPVLDVYFLSLHEPYRSPGLPRPIDCTIVDAQTLLHAGVPQPDGGRMYRCLTERPDRTPGCIVPLSTLTWELSGGDLWPQVGDWEAVVDAVVGLARRRACDSIRVGLTGYAHPLLSMGPHSRLHVYELGGDRTCLGPADRQQELRRLEERVYEFARGGAFWPGDDLVAAPDVPDTMPYAPYQPP